MGADTHVCEVRRVREWAQSSFVLPESLIGIGRHIPHSRAENNMSEMD